MIRIGEEAQLFAKSLDINLLKPKLNDHIIKKNKDESPKESGPPGWGFKNSMTGR